MFFTDKKIAENLPEGVAPSPENMEEARTILEGMIRDFINTIDITEALECGNYRKNLFWYLVSFYGGDDFDSPEYVTGKSECWVVKTEIPPEKGLSEAAIILLEGMDQEHAKELKDHVTSVRLIDDEEAYLYSVDHLTKRVTDIHGTYYVQEDRKDER